MVEKARNINASEELTLENQLVVLHQTLSNDDVNQSSSLLRNIATQNRQLEL